MGLYLHDVVSDIDNFIMCCCFFPNFLFYNKNFGYEVKETQESIFIRKVSLIFFFSI